MLLVKDYTGNKDSFIFVSEYVEISIFIDTHSGFMYRGQQYCSNYQIYTYGCNGNVVNRESNILWDTSMSLAKLFRTNLIF